MTSKWFAAELGRRQPGPSHEGLFDGLKWEGFVLGQAPVQGYGDIDGFPWYFRARWSAWSLTVANSRDGDPVEASPGGGDGWETGEDDPKRWGEFDAGWMEEEEAWQLIKASLEAWTRRPK